MLLAGDCAGTAPAAGRQTAGKPALSAGKTGGILPCGRLEGDCRAFSADFEEKIQVVHKKDLKNRADYARITLLYSALTLRTRQPGDRFRPAGRGLSKPLRKWMNEAGIPAGIREGLPLLAAGSEILWVCGEGFAEGLAPDEETVQILQLELENGGTTHEHE